MGLVRVARFADLTEAKVVTAALQAAGIPALLQNEQMGANDFLIQAALGGFAILTPEEEAREAATFIRAHRTAPPVEAANSPVDAEEETEWRRDAAKRRGLFIRWAVVVVFVAPIPLVAIIALVSRLIGTP